MTARPILRYNRHLDFFGARVDDRLEVEAGGDVWRWALFPARADRQDEAGTYRLTLSASELDDIQQLVEHLVGPGRASPEGHMAALLESNGREISLPDTGPNDELLGVRHRLDELADRALAGPLHVIRLTARRSASPAHGQVVPIFVLENTGKERVSVLTRAAGFSVLTVQAEGNRIVFRGDSSATGGFFDDQGEMIDGLLRPAMLEPHASATMAFSQALEAGGATRLLASVEGRISISGPLAEDDFPSTAFRISAALE
jgi:hypothetical protein